MKLPWTMLLSSDLKTGMYWLGPAFLLMMKKQFSEWPSRLP